MRTTVVKQKSPTPLAYEVLKDKPIILSPRTNGTTANAIKRNSAIAHTGVTFNNQNTPLYSLIFAPPVLF
jgi:hypothetical protein